MFYCTLGLKMGAYFRNGFELNTPEHKLLRITIPHLEVDLGDRNCLKMGAYFQDVFEINTTEHKLLRFVILHLVADSM